ncbi:MAG: hypothetical protein HOK06_08585, partial [Rhodospirillaceae bacterium]|nr:hypothetical protein [Rhodospirillaceae bacterium]
GDKYDFTVDGNPVSYTATGLEGSLAGLRTAITAAFNTAVGGIITATDNTADGEIKLTADTANSAFTTVVTGATNIGPVSQVDTVTLSGLYAAGDIVSVAVDGNPTVPYTVIADDLTVNGDGTGGAVAGDSTIAYNNITTKVAAAVNADGVSSGIVTAAASGGGGGVVTLTADTAGTAFAKSTSLTTATTAVATATTPTPNVVATAQVNNVTLTGTFSAGDDISINIDAIGAVVYTVTANDLTANGDGTGGVVAGNSAAAYNNITTQVAANLNADAPTGAVVTAAAPGGGGGVVTITADTAGTAFAQVTSDTSAGTATETTPTPNVAAVAQIDNATLTGAYSVGDTVSISVDGETVVYTVLADDLTANGDGTGGLVAGDSAAAYNNITAKIATGLNGSTPMAALVTAAAPGGGGGVVTLTGTTAGTSFTQTTTATRTRSGTITEGNTQANIVGLADNTASFVTTQVAEAGIQPAVAQVDNVTLTGTFVATDIVTVNVDSLGDISYTVTANDLTVNGDGTGGAATAAQMQANIATKVASAISDNATTSAVVTATSSGSAIVLTAVNAGTSFSTASSVTDSTSSGNNQTSVITTPTANFEGGIPAVAQVDNAAITGTFAATDTVSINIDSLGAVTYTVVADDLTVNGDGTGGVATAAQTRAHIATNLASLVNATAATAAVVTASVSSESIVLTADSAGTAFTLVTAATDVSGTVGGQASTGTTTTANAAAIISNTDNAATLQSVTATENPFSNIPVGASITIANATNSANNTTYTVAANTGSVITVASTQTVVSSSGNDLSSSLTITSDISYYSGDEVARTHKTSKTREFTM